MPSPSIFVLALATPAEREMQFQFAEQAFSHELSPASMRYWQQYITTMPGYRAEQLRGAFCNGEQGGTAARMGLWWDQEEQPK